MQPAWQALLQQLKLACEGGRWQQAELWLRQLEQAGCEPALLAFGQGYFKYCRGELASARPFFAQALDSEPGFREAAFNLARTDQQMGHFLQATQDLEAILVQSPFELPALQQLVSLYQLTGQLASLHALGQHLLQPGWQRQPGFLKLPLAQRQGFLAWLPQLEALLLINHFAQNQAHPEQMPELLQKWRRHLGSRKPTPPIRPRHSGQPLRIAYVSREWGAPPLELGFGMLFRHHTENFELLAYCDEGQPLEPQYFAQVKDSSGWDEQTFCQHIRADAVDILVDLSGFFNAGRLLSLAHKPAPLQILAGSNPPFVSGLSCFDAVFSDRILMPPELVTAYPETFCYQASFFHWKPPVRSPDPGPLMPDGIPRLGALASPNKLNDFSLHVWARTLQALPTASLLLKHQAYSDPLLQNQLRQRFARLGGDPSRLDFVDNRQHKDYFVFLQNIDLLLDTFPYGGALSSCDALWMGVPVVSLGGGHRIAESIAHNLGLTDLLAGTVEDFQQLVVSLCARPEKLAAWRTELRARLLASPICDGPRQASEAEADYTRLWQAMDLSAPSVNTSHKPE